MIPKKWFVIAAILLLVTATGAGVVLYRGNLAHISITVKPPSVNFYTIGISIGELNSLHSCDINGKCVDDRYIFIIPPVPTVLPPELVRV
jgi:hypothetical protein